MITTWRRVEHPEWWGTFFDVVADLTRDPPVETEPVEVSNLVAIPRATTSSRTPGRINRGTIYIAKPVLEVCRHCGRMRRSTVQGAHAPHLAGGGSPRIIDCAGVTCVRGADGYHHREGEA